MGSTSPPLRRLFQGLRFRVLGCRFLGLGGVSVWRLRSEGLGLRVYPD